MSSLPNSGFEKTIEDFYARRQQSLWPNTKVGDKVTVTVEQLRFEEPANMFDIHQRAVEFGLDGVSAQGLEYEARKHGSRRMWTLGATFTFTRIS